MTRRHGFYSKNSADHLSTIRDTARQVVCCQWDVSKNTPVANRSLENPKPNIAEQVAKNKKKRFRDLPRIRT